jgi:universal stress protein E
MQSLNRLLVIIDPDADTQVALDKALKLARAADAELELVTADHSTYLDDGYYYEAAEAGNLREMHLGERREMLEQMSVVLREQGFRVKVDALWGKPTYECIVRKVLQSEPDLLVHSTRHHEKIARLLLSHQDWQLLRYCPCPVLLVKDRPWQQQPAVLVAVDPTHANDKPAALDYSLTEAGVLLAGLTGGQAHLFHSYHQTPVSGIYPVSVDPTLYREQAEQFLRTFEIPESRLHLSEEEIQRALPELAEQLGAAVIVMGAVSRSRLDRILVGSTAERLLDRLEQDVLVLKPEGFTDKVRKARPESREF